MNGTNTAISDARHEGRKNRFHTGHIAFWQIKHKVLYIQRITKEDYDDIKRHEHVACSWMHGARTSRIETFQNTRMIGTLQSTSWSKRVESKTLMTVGMYPKVLPLTLKRWERDRNMTAAKPCILATSGQNNSSDKSHLLVYWSLWRKSIKTSTGYLFFTF